MKFSAVIFDLFGTIIKDITGPPYDRAMQKMASVLSADYTDLSRLWLATVYERNIGHFPTLEGYIKYICQTLGVSVNDEQMSTAAKIRHDLARKSMIEPRPGSLDILFKLRENNYKIGLISDCSPSDPDIWSDTSFVHLFDVAIFSCIVKMKKPDPEIFKLAASRLNVGCSDCLYVGNGGSDEIKGAREAGMYPVLILPERRSKEYVVPSDEIIEYAKSHGGVISAFKEILSIIY